MYTIDKLKQELKSHSVHVCHGQHAQHLVALLDLRSQYVYSKVIVAPQSTVGYHHSLGVAGGSTGIVDQRKLLGFIFVIVQMIGSEVQRIFLSEKQIQILTCIRELLVGTTEQTEISERDDALQSGHCFGFQLWPYMVTYKQELSTAVVHDIMNLRGVKLMQDGYSHSTIGENTE